jgi:hypothetical protein
MAMKIQVEVFWVVRPCSDMVGYQCFGGPCCLYLLGEDGGNTIRHHNLEVLGLDIRRSLLGISNYNFDKRGASLGTAGAKPNFILRDENIYIW